MCQEARDKADCLFVYVAQWAGVRFRIMQGDINSLQVFLQHQVTLDGSQYIRACTLNTAEFDHSLTGCQPCQCLPFADFLRGLYSWPAQSTGKGHEHFGTFGVSAPTIARAFAIWHVIAFLARRRGFTEAEVPQTPFKYEIHFSFCSSAQRTRLILVGVLVNPEPKSMKSQIILHLVAVVWFNSGPCLRDKTQ